MTNPTHVDEKELRDKCAAVIAFDGEYQRTVDACAKSPIAEMGRYDAYLRKRSTIDLHGPDIARATLQLLDERAALMRVLELKELDYCETAQGIDEDSDTGADLLEAVIAARKVVGGRNSLQSAGRDMSADKARPPG